MSCWEILGLEEEADERAIRRQYARLLKSTRPDEDPVAFQALREAYEQALCWVQWRAGAGEGANESLIEAVDAGDLVVAVRPVVEPVAPVAEVDQRLGQLAELLADLQPSLLTERRLKAEKIGLAVEFERGVLRECLKAEWGSYLRDAACAEYGWLEMREAPALSAAERLPVYERIVDAHLASLRSLHNRGEPGELIEGLKTLLNQIWLQSYDGRALLERAVVSMLLEMPFWSCDTLDQVAAVFAWQEGQREANCPDYQWRELLERWDAERYYARVLDNARRWELTAECRAARLVLAPMDRLQRRRFMSDFGEEERQHGTTIARAFVYRYPHLQERLPGAPLDEDFWRDLEQSGPWVGRTPVLWGALLVFCGLTVAPAELAKQNPDYGVLLIGLPVVSIVLAWVLNRVIGWFQGMSGNALAKLDYRLSGFLPASWHQHGAGIHPLWHGAISYVLALAVGGASGLRLPDLWLQALIIAPGMLLSLHLFKYFSLIGRVTGLLARLWSRYQRYLHIVVLLFIALTVVAAMVLKSASETKPRYQTEAEIARYCQEAKNHGDIRCVLRDAANSPPASGD
ncbi:MULTISPECIES: J domain-containing protein [Pseudomonas]|uniref:J domain-containing protein n=1 Tax=Pseudomonas nitroreducens TaxID=46680 RepID=UPI00147AE3DF|nr:MULTISPECIES: J domain-containing protein [Pseudomonas]NNN26043.1 J domain-containing protein [Pseudomonas nitroreducens]